MNKTRVLVVGLDGATFDIIGPMVAEGKLPTLSSLMAEGAWGNLRSTILPVTPPAWASFMTGKNPGKHGAFGFYSFTEGSCHTELATGLSVKAKKIWDYFDGSKKVGLIDIPMTFPPQKLNGYMISGMPVPSEESNFTYPPDLHIELIRELGEYMIDRDLMQATRNNPVASLKLLYSYSRMRRYAAEYLITRKGAFDFFMVVFRGIDFVQHAAFKFFDTDYTSRHIEETKKFGNVIFQVYEKMDQYLAELIKMFGKDSTVAVMSDHGGGPLRKRFHLNRWLRKKGFLVLKNTSRKGLKIKKKEMAALLDRVGVSILNIFLPEKIKSIKLPIPLLYTKHPVDLIDWERTKAYANLVWTDGVIRINLKGREPNGIIDPRNYDELRDRIITDLREVADPETGEKIIEAAYKREEVYSGPFVKDAPDILLLTRNLEYAFTSSLLGDQLFERPQDPAPANHRMEGIFLIKGPNIVKEVNLRTIDIVDIAPTILYLMGYPIPEDMDGRVINEAIEEAYQREYPVKYTERDEYAERASDEIPFTDDERRKIEESLRSLGYID